MNKDEEVKMSSSRQVLLSFLGILILIVAVVGISYAAFNYSKAGTRENVIKTGTISMSYNESTNGINISNAIPMNEETALKTYTGNSTYVDGGTGEYNYKTPEDANTSKSDNVFDFTVSLTTKGTATASYDIAAVKDATKVCDASVYTNVKVESPTTEALTAYGNCQYVSDTDIRLRLGKFNSSKGAETEDAAYEAVTIPNKLPESGASSYWRSNASETSNGTPAVNATSDYMVLYTGTLTATSTNGAETITTEKFRLKMWVDEAYVIDGNARTYSVKVNVYAKS